ncbi:leucine-rich repeat domain-containing protein, partial [Chamaesiphon sp. GL140_3_metabinner_50]|uniref:leucine-rich repeat domain-containing protein n=1 Tax=Chamaesiphon sp. GL140_3_metabinner_50 TaxID=2970812 RepID=UPI0025DD1CCD
ALKSLDNLETVMLFGSSLPYQYWTEFSEWKAEWLLDEDDARIRRALIKQVGFDRVCQLSGLTRLELNNWQLTELPANVENLCNLLNLDLTDNQLASLPENIGNLSRLYDLKLSRNQLTSLPESFENLFNLSNLDLSLNKLEKLPDNFIYLLNLTTIDLNGNLIEDLSILQSLLNLKTVCFYNVYLPRRYWIKFSEWKSEWLLDEDNVEIRQILIERIGYDRICTELKAVAIDTWREYTLLKIDGVEKIYDDEEQPIDTEPMVLLKMTCPSTAHIHILRVPPEMVSAEAAITWVNHGIHPDEFIVQT